MTMEPVTRRRVGLLIRITLILAAFAVVGVWVRGKATPSSPVSVVREAPPVEALGPGDLRIESVGGEIAITLQGGRLMAGLSPATVAKIRADIEKSSTKDTSGFGGMIAGIVKSSVASAIGTNVTYPVADVKSLRFDGRQFVLVTMSGETHRLFGDVKTDEGKEPPSFSKTDADRLVAAVDVRKAELANKP
jgi:hypothetical protein